MKRRNFIKLTASASAIGLFPGQITNALNIGKQFINCDISNRKLVLIYLGGGNDNRKSFKDLNLPFFSLSLTIFEIASYPTFFNAPNA